MGLEAVEDDLDVLRRQRLRRDVVSVAGMEHQRGVDALEQTVLDHDRLAAAPLLRRRAEEHDLARQLVGERREGDRGADPDCRHRVVAAAVTQTRQRVVLGEDPDPAVPFRRLASCRRRGSPGSPSRASRPGCSTANPCRGASRPPTPTPGPPRTRSPGWPWIRCDRSRISSRAADRGRQPALGRLAARPVRRRVGAGGGRSRAVTGPPMGRVARRARVGSAAVTMGSAFDRQHRLGDDDQGEDEQGDGRLEAPPAARRITNTATTTATQPPRRTARVQSPR